MTEDLRADDATPNADANAAPAERRRRFRAVRRLLRAEVYYVVALAAFGVLTAFAYLNAYFGWDLRTARAVQGVEGVYGFMRFVSLAGDGWTPYALTGVTALVFLLFRRKSEAEGLFFSAAGSGIVARLIKMSVGRPRPTADLVQIFTEGDALSFPSGHVTFYVTYFGFLFFAAYALLPRGSLARRVALLLTALPVLLIGLSRVYLGRHWPSDTLGAYLMGGLWLALALDLYRRRKQRRTAKPAQ